MSRFLKEQLKNLEPYVPGEQPNHSGLIKLNTNESPFPPAPGVLSVLNREEGEKLRLYSDPAATELRRAAADFYGIPESRIIAGNGSDELLAFLFMAYGKRIYYPSISYGFYKIYGEIFAEEALEIPLVDELSIRPEDYHGLPGTIILANPNAPTGRALTREEIKGILRANRDQLVVVDEAYVDFGAESMIPCIEEFDNLLVIQTLSKSRSLAGGRVGVAMGQEELIEDLNRIRFSFNPYNLNRLSILAGAAAFRDREYFEKCCRIIVANREQFVSELKKQGFRILPSKANFVFVKPPGMGGEDYYQALRDRNILVRHFKNPSLSDFVRITIGTWEELDQILIANKEMGLSPVGKGEEA